MGDDVGDPGTARVSNSYGGIAPNADVRVFRDGRIGFSRSAFGAPNNYMLDDLFIRGGEAFFGGLGLGVQAATLTMEGGKLTIGGPVDLGPGSSLTVHGTIAATSIAPAASFPGGRALIESGSSSNVNGTLRLTTAAQAFLIADGPEAIDAEFNIPITPLVSAGVNKLGAGVAVFGGDNTYTGETTVTAGTLLVNGNSPSSAIQVAGGRLGGTGTVGALNASAGSVTPGTSPGVLSSSGAVVLAAGVEFGVEIASTAANGYDQLHVTGPVTIGDSLLVLAAPLGLPGAAVFTIIDNDGTDPVVGTFAGLPEGTRTIAPGGARFRISYVGGDGS